MQQRRLAAAGGSGQQPRLAGAGMPFRHHDRGHRAIAVREPRDVEHDANLAQTRRGRIVVRRRAVHAQGTPGDAFALHATRGGRRRDGAPDRRATPRSVRISAANCAGVSACSASHQASGGFGVHFDQQAIGARRNRGAGSAGTIHACRPRARDRR